MSLAATTRAAMNLGRVPFVLECPMKRYLWSLSRGLSDEMLHRFCTVTMLSRDLAALCLFPDTIGSPQ